MPRTKLTLKQKRTLTEVKNYLLVFLGCTILAFGDAAFLGPCNLVTGGLFSLGLLVNRYVEPALGFNVTDIVVAVAQMGLWILGLSILGWRFSMKTLFGTLVYPIAYSLMLRFNIGNAIGLSVLYDGETIHTLLAALFGGFLVGAGVAFAYLGSGSTGGLDVISVILAKYTPLKEDLSGLLLDALLVLLGLLLPGNGASIDVVHVLFGLIGAFMCAMAIQYIYINAGSFIICDIFSERYKEIQEYIHVQLDHATTEVDVVGGYSGQPRKMLRVAINRREQMELRSFIASVDPKAFVTFSPAKAINGEGFIPIVREKTELPHKKIAKLLKKKKKDGSDDA